MVVRPDARLGLAWIDCNGVRWDLVNGPARLTRAGLRGLGLPDSVYFESESAGVDGQQLNGWRIKSREVFVPFRFKDEAARDTTGVQRVFWDGVQIGRYGTFEVTDPDGGVRTLTMRIKDDGSPAYKVDPHLVSEQYGLTFTADDPWYYGEDIVARFGIGDSTGADFFNGAAQAPSFNIVGASGSTSTTVNNPGDQPSWFTWWVAGPSAGFRIGVDGHYVSGQFEVASGSSLGFNTNPREQTVQLDGVNVPYRSFTELDFAPVPPGASVPVEISVVGQGLITGVGRTKYFRGF